AAIEEGSGGEATLAVTLARLGDLHEEGDDVAAARAAREKALALARKAHGDKHWRTTTARLALARTDALRRMTAERRRRLREAASKQERAVELADKARRSRLGPRDPQPSALFREVIATRAELLGEAHELTADALHDAGRYALQKSLWEEARACIA